MSDQSRMDIGDPLGDRFWLSPKKGKWQTLIDHDVMQEKEAGCSERVGVGIGRIMVYVIKRCGQILTHFSHFGIWGAT